MRSVNTAVDPTVAPNRCIAQCETKCKTLKSVSSYTRKKQEPRIKNK